MSLIDSAIHNIFHTAVKTIPPKTQEAVKQEEKTLAGQPATYWLNRYSLSHERISQAVTPEVYEQGTITPVEIPRGKATVLTYRLKGQDEFHTLTVFRTREVGYPPGSERPFVPISVMVDQGTVIPCTEKESHSLSVNGQKLHLGVIGSFHKYALYPQGMIFWVDQDVEFTSSSHFQQPIEKVKIPKTAKIVQ